jgi:hypothetical protein
VDMNEGVTLNKLKLLWEWWSRGVAGLRRSSQTELEAAGQWWRGD